MIKKNNNNNKQLDIERNFKKFNYIYWGNNGFYDHIGFKCTFL